MDRQYVFGRAERADAGKAGQPIRFVATNSGRQADGLDLQMSGVRLERFDANPVVGFGHAFWGRENLPIGRGVGTEVEDERLLIDVEFDQGDPFAVDVERKIRGGFLNAVSIGFDVVAVERDGTVTEWELFELSVVPIPMDAGAVVESGRVAELVGAVRSYEAALRASVADPDPAEGSRDLAGGSFEELADLVADAVEARLVERGWPRTGAPVSTEPVRIPPTDAAALLAALDHKKEHSHE